MNNEILKHYIHKHFTTEQLELLRDIPLYGPRGIRRYIAERDIEAFTRLYFSAEFTLPFAPIHYQMLEDMQQIRDRMVADRPGLKLARAIPRNHAKSTFYSRLLPLHGFLFNWSKLTVLLGNNDDSARRLVSNIKTIIDTNETIKEDFPDIRGSTWGIEKLENNRGGILTGYGVGSGAIRGISTGQYRPSLVILDDVDDDKSVRSAVELANNIEWFDKAVLAIGDNIQYTTSFIAVGTIIRKTSLLKYVLDSTEFNSIIEKAVKHFAINESLWEQWRNHITELARGNIQPKDATEDIFYQTHKEELLKGTEVLWARPDAYRQMMLFKLHNDKAFASEMQNNPQDNSYLLGDIIKVAALPTDYSDWVLFAALDTSIKGNKNSDLSAFVELLYNHKTKQMIVNHVDAKRRNYAQTINEVSHRILSNPLQYNEIFVEENSAGFIIANDIEANIADKGYSITRKYNTLPKIERIGTLSQYLDNKQLVFYAGLDDEIFTELDTYPLSKNDDVIDALSISVMELRKRGYLDLITYGV